MSEIEDHFEIDEIENFIDNLEMVTYFLESPFPYRWIWVTIALHQALYGALISTLKGTDPRQTVVDRQKDSGKAVMLHVNRVPVAEIASSFGTNEKTIRDWISNPFLISLDEALRRVKRKECLPSVSNARPLVTSQEEDNAIRKLIKEFRNEFEHFAPKQWVVFTSIFPPIARNVLRVIHFLVLESECVYLSPEQEQRIKAASAKIEYLLDS